MMLVTKAEPTKIDGGYTILVDNEMLINLLSQTGLADNHEFRTVITTLRLQDQKHRALPYVVRNRTNEVNGKLHVVKEIKENLGLSLYDAKTLMEMMWYEKMPTTLTILEPQQKQFARLSIPKNLILTHYNKLKYCLEYNPDVHIFLLNNGILAMPL